MYCNVDIVILLQLINHFCAFLCWTEQEAFVLCRVFHKNNIGPPNGQRYAPFVEEEWEEGSGMVPGAEPVTVSNGPVDRHLRLEWNGGVSCSEGRNHAVQVCSRSLPVFLGAYLIFVVSHYFCRYAIRCHYFCRYAVRYHYFCRYAICYHYFCRYAMEYIY